MTTAAVGGRQRVLGIVAGRARVSPRARAARHHAHVRRGLVAGVAGRDRGCDRLVSGDIERWAHRVTCAAGTDLEASGIDVRRGMAARAVAVEAADRDVVARSLDDGDVGKGSGARTMAAETTRHALVDADYGIHRVVAGGVA